MEHLSAMQIAVPLVAAPICVLLRHARLTWAFCLAVCWGTFGISVMLLQQVMTSGVIDYELGGWPAPYGIVYRLDLVGAFVLIIVSSIAAVCMAWAPLSLDKELPRENHYLFYSAYLLCLTGLLGMTITGDAFNVFVFLEISSLSSYALISLGQTRKALTAAYQYLIMGSIGGTFILIGIGLMYMMTGTLNMLDLAERVPQVAHTRTILVSFAFITVGASLKLALYPLHFWLPNAYTYAPSVISAFISATSTKVMVYVLIRFVFTVYGVEFSFGTLGLGLPLMILSLVGIYAASTAAIFQNNAKRLLAYSSVAQIGYMILGISLASATGLAAGILHLFNHALMKGGLFLALGNVFYRTGTVHLEDLGGVGKRMPWTMAAFVVGGMGLIGVPLTVGFASKWLLISAFLEAGVWWVAVLALISSLLAVAYVWKVIEVAYFEEPSEFMATVTEAPVWMLVPTWVLIGASVWFGTDAAGTTDIAMRAARILLGEGA